MRWKFRTLSVLNANILLFILSNIFVCFFSAFIQFIFSLVQTLVPCPPIQIFCYFPVSQADHRFRSSAVGSRCRAPQTGSAQPQARKWFRCHCRLGKQNASIWVAMRFSENGERERRRFPNLMDILDWYFLLGFISGTACVVPNLLGDEHSGHAVQDSAVQHRAGRYWGILRQSNLNFKSEWMKRNDFVPSISFFVMILSIAVWIHISMRILIFRFCFSTQWLRSSCKCFLGWWRTLQIRPAFTRPCFQWISINWWASWPLGRRTKSCLVCALRCSEHSCVDEFCRNPRHLSFVSKFISYSTHFLRPSFGIFLIHWPLAFGSFFVALSNQFWMWLAFSCCTPMPAPSCPPTPRCSSCGFSTHVRARLLTRPLCSVCWPTGWRAARSKNTSCSFLKK